METRDMPEIRFEGFSHPWEQRKLGNIADVIDPHPSHRAPAAVESGIPFIGIGDVDEAGNINHSTARIVDEKIYDEHHKRYDLSIPSIGIGRVASLGKVIRLRNDIGKYAVSPTMSIIQFDSGVDGNYMYSYMTSSKFQKQFSSQSNGSTRQSVGIQDLRELLVEFPLNKCEQEAIGQFFWDVDNTITLHQRQLDNLKNLKKGCLQKMFPRYGETKPELRFPGFTDDWEQRKLGDLMDVGSVKRVHQSDWRDSGVRFLRARDVVADFNNEEPDDYLYIDQKMYEEYSAQSGKVQQGDLLVTGVGTIGIPMLIKSEKPLYFKDGNIIWFKNKNAIDGQFFYYSFISKGIQDFIKESAGIGTVGTYTIDSGKKTPINLPTSIEEQKEIGIYFKNLDHLITLHQRKCDKLRQAKSALLNQMFV